VKYCDTCHSAYPDDFTSCPRDSTPLRGTSELPAGLVLRGKYQILEKIGSGGMATVYRARHLAFGEIRAIKVVSGRLSEDAVFLRRFRAEAVVARKLQHPNAVRVDDLDATEDGRPFIVMEHFEGRDLRELVKTTGPLTATRALRIASQVASALGAAHALGITHRDIKPDNILVGSGPDGGDVAKVLDFGIAKVREGFFDAGEGYSPTQTGTVLGTPQYISPEQAMGKKAEEVDGRADLYSLGVVLYEMVTGRLPFQSDTAMGMILHHLQSAPTPPDLARPDLSLPAALCDVLMRALQKDPGARFQTAEEMKAQLDRLAALPELAEVRATPLPIDTEAPTRAFAAAQARTVMPQQAHTAPALPGPEVVPTPTPRRRWRHYVGLALGLGLVSMICNRPEQDPPSRRSRADPPAPSAPASGPAPDAETVAEQEELVEKVEEALSNARATEDQPIEVTAEEDVIVLRGVVPDTTVRAVAEALAEAVPGVDSVRNELTVNGVVARVAPVPPVGPVQPPDFPRLPAPFGLRPSPGSREAQRLDEAIAEGEKALAEGDTRAALHQFTRAMQLDPSDPRSAEGLARATTLITVEAQARAAETEARQQELQRERDKREQERRARARARAVPSPP
jgi:serine/threonine protein kinase